MIFLNLKLFRIMGISVLKVSIWTKPWMVYTIFTKFTIYISVTVWYYEILYDFYNELKG